MKKPKLTWKKIRATLAAVGTDGVSVRREPVYSNDGEHIADKITVFGVTITKVEECH